ncbi:esterase E4 [Haematobia irritans]|uniref:esterase E4 n=1 Tax=Haematobia irritans TaxID=7368 RepID=UPI003F500643
MSEDCLKLNVFTRNITARFPVMVYIHGGANVLGSGHSLYEAGPNYLLDHDVVLVAFNYRLGALGFLSTQTEEYPGNYGYLDQVLALKWVKEHIANFGGDPDSVTIFGMSAGSMAVSLHIASPLSKGLFHKAILMSGSAANHYAIDNIYWTRKLAKELSCPQYNPTDMVECLREISWKTIVNKCAEWEPYSFVNMKWNYEVDGYFLPEHPSTIFAQGKHNKVPMIVGFSRNELDYSVHQNNSRLLNDLAVSFDSYAPEIFLYEPESPSVPKDQLKSRRIWNFYMGQNTVAINETNLQNFGEIFSDAILGHGIHRLVKLLSKDTEIYYYRTDYVGRRSLYEDNNGQPRGIGHADDLQYIMPGLWYGTQLGKDDPDIFMVNRMTGLWATFAQTGYPITPDIPNWKALTETEPFVLYNDKTPSFGSWPYVERYQLWDEMFPLAVNSKGCNLPTITGNLGKPETKDCTRPTGSEEGEIYIIDRPTSHSPSTHTAVAAYRIAMKLIRLFCFLPDRSTHIRLPEITLKLWCNVWQCRLLFPDYCYCCCCQKPEIISKCSLIFVGPRLQLSDKCLQINLSVAGLIEYVNAIRICGVEWSCKSRFSSIGQNSNESRNIENISRD